VTSPGPSAPTRAVQLPHQALGAYHRASHSKDFNFNSRISQPNLKSKVWAQHPQTQLPLLKELGGKKQKGAEEEWGCGKGQGGLDGPGVEVPVELRSGGVTRPEKQSVLCKTKHDSHFFNKCFELKR